MVLTRQRADELKNELESYGWGMKENGNSIAQHLYWEMIRTAQKAIELIWFFGEALH